MSKNINILIQHKDIKSNKIETYYKKLSLGLIYPEEPLNLHKSLLKLIYKRQINAILFRYLKDHKKLRVTLKRNVIEITCLILARIYKIKEGFSKLGSVPAIGGYSGKFIKTGINQFRKIDRKVMRRSNIQGAWNKDHSGFEISIGQVLGNSKTEKLGELMSNAFTANELKNKAPVEVIDALSPKQRLRAMQVGFFLD